VRHVLNKYAQKQPLSEYELDLNWVDRVNEAAPDRWTKFHEGVTNH
jgi:hypothetical protein